MKVRRCPRNGRKVRAGAANGGAGFASGTPPLVHPIAMMVTWDTKMSATDAMLAELQGRRPGMSLDQKFYADPGFYRLDLETIFYRDWLFAGHDCEIPAPGDYFTMQVGDYPIIVVRGRDGTIGALHNSCRHRGSRICPAARGSAKRLVCPYHQWTYDLDGSLISRPSCRRGPGQGAVRAETRPLRERRGLYLRLRRAGRAKLRTFPGPGGALSVAPQARRRQGRFREHDRRERQLEARLGEQPGVLSLRRESPRALPNLQRQADRFGN